MTVILGFNAFHADSAACLVVDGTLVGAVAEERLGARIKHSSAFPENAIRRLLADAGLTLRDVTHVAMARDPKVVVFGESLGSFAGESAFGTIPSITARTNGALFVGPTFSNTVWNDATANRDAGSNSPCCSSRISPSAAEINCIARPTAIGSPD